jgi:hypothetical protein
VVCCRFSTCTRWRFGLYVERFHGIKRAIFTNVRPASYHGMFHRHVLHPERIEPGRWARTASTLSQISLCLYLVAFPVSCLHFCSSGHFTILTTICFMGLLFLPTNVLGLGSYDIRRLHAAYAHARLVHSTATLFFLLIGWENMARSRESLNCHINNHFARHGPTSTLVPDIYTWQCQG